MRQTKTHDGNTNVSCETKKSQRQVDASVKKKKSIFEYSPQDPKVIMCEIVKADCMNHGYRLTNKTLGSGAYAKVKVAEVLTGKLARNKALSENAEETGSFQVAIKVIEKRIVPKEFLRKFLPREIQNHTSLPKHEHVIRVYDHFATQDHLYVVMELCENGDLLELINKNIGENHRGIGEDLARKLFRQMCEGVLHIHSLDIIHRDLKCENIILTENYDAKITDFGFSCKWTDKDVLLRTSCGSYAYTAPEVIKNKPYDGYKSDTWSLGIILFAMANGRLPFNDSQLMEMDEDMRMQRLRFERTVSFECMVLVRRLLQYNPAVRPPIQEILNDPWITGRKPIPRQVFKPKWVNPYVAKKEQQKTEQLSVDTQSQPKDTQTDAVSYEMVTTDLESANAGSPTSSVTVSQENRETIILKSRFSTRRNIRTVSPTATRRPNTWPTQTLQDKTSSTARTSLKPESPQERKEKYAERYSDSYMMHLLNMYRGALEKHQSKGSKSKTKPELDSKSKQMLKSMPTWFLDKMMQAGTKVSIPPTPVPVPPRSPNNRKDRKRSRSTEQKTDKGPGESSNGKRSVSPKERNPTKNRTETALDVRGQNASTRCSAANKSPSKQTISSHKGKDPAKESASASGINEQEPRKCHSTPKTNEDIERQANKSKSVQWTEEMKNVPTNDKFAQIYEKFAKNFNAQKAKMPSLLIHPVKLFKEHKNNSDISVKKSSLSQSKQPASATEVGSRSSSPQRTTRKSPRPTAGSNHHIVKPKHRVVVHSCC